MTDDQQFLYQVACDPKKTKKLMKIYSDLKEANLNLGVFVYVFSAVFFVIGLAVGYFVK